MSNDSWFFGKGGQQLGPVTLDALRAMVQGGQLQPSDLVWKDGMPNWTEARFVPEFAGSFSAVPPGAAAAINYYTPQVPAVEYGGFWLRFLAAFLDGLILFVPNLIIQYGIRAAFGLPIVETRPRPPGGADFGAIAVTFVIQTAIGWLYSALQESSEAQATLGKRVLKLYVSDLSGQRVSFARATGRHFGKWVSGFTLAIGFIMAGFTERKQALHDIMAGTLVLRRRA